MITGPHVHDGAILEESVMASFSFNDRDARFNIAASDEAHRNVNLDDPGATGLTGSPQNHDTLFKEWINPDLYIHAPAEKLKIEDDGPDSKDKDKDCNAVDKVNELSKLELFSLRWIPPFTCLTGNHPGTQDESELRRHSFEALYEMHDTSSPFSADHTSVGSRWVETDGFNLSIYDLGHDHFDYGRTLSSWIHADSDLEIEAKDDTELAFAARSEVLPNPLTLGKLHQPIKRLRRPCQDIANVRKAQAHLSSGSPKHRPELGLDFNEESDDSTSSADVDAVEKLLQVEKVDPESDQDSINRDKRMARKGKGKAGVMDSSGQVPKESTENFDPNDCDTNRRLPDERPVDRVGRGHRDAGKAEAVKLIRKIKLTEITQQPQPPLTVMMVTPLFHGIANANIRTNTDGALDVPVVNEHTNMLLSGYPSEHRGFEDGFKNVCDAGIGELARCPPEYVKPRSDNTISSSTAHTGLGTNDAVAAIRADDSEHGHLRTYHRSTADYASAQPAQVVTARTNPGAEFPTSTVASPITATSWGQSQIQQRYVYYLSRKANQSNDDGLSSFSKSIGMQNTRPNLKYGGRGVRHGVETETPSTGDASRALNDRPNRDRVQTESRTQAQAEDSPPQAQGPIPVPPIHQTFPHVRENEPIPPLSDLHDGTGRGTVTRPRAYTYSHTQPVRSTQVDSACVPHDASPVPHPRTAGASDGFSGNGRPRSRSVDTRGWNGSTELVGPSNASERRWQWPRGIGSPQQVLTPGPKSGKPYVPSAFVPTSAWHFPANPAGGAKQQFPTQTTHSQSSSVVRTAHEHAVPNSAPSSSAVSAKPSDEYRVGPIAPLPSRWASTFRIGAKTRSIPATNQSDMNEVVASVSEWDRTIQDFTQDKVIHPLSGQSGLPFNTRIQRDVENSGANAAQGSESTTDIGAKGFRLQDPMHTYVHMPGSKLTGVGDRRKSGAMFAPTSTPLPTPNRSGSDHCQCEDVHCACKWWNQFPDFFPPTKITVADLDPILTPPVPKEFIRGRKGVEHLSLCEENNSD